MLLVIVMVFGLVLLDIVKFYDAIRLRHIIRSGRLLGYSAKVLYLNALTCLGPRVLRQGPACSRAICPSQSVVAGLGGAGNMGKLVVYSAMENTPLKCRAFPRGSM